MVAKTMKRTMVYSNEGSKQLIEGIIGDEINRKNTSFSYEMESIILTHLLTDNRLVNRWIQCLYSSEFKISDIFGMIFEYNSAGVYFESQHLPLFDIVHHLKLIDSMTYGENRKFDSSELPDILYCIDSLKGVCESKIKNEDPKKRKYKDALMCLEPIIRDLKNNKVRHSDFYILVLTFWDELKDSTHTFRTLSHYAFSQSISEISSDLRLDFLNLLKELAKNWPKEEE